MIISPNMALPVPQASIDSGPAWATEVQNSLTIIDAHNHAPGSGVPINPAGLNINADLPINSNNLTVVRSVRFTPSTIAATSPDLGCIYVQGVDLYYNDENGNKIQITSSGSVNSGAGSISGLPSGTASATYLPTSGTFRFQQATSTAANIDGATLILRYPGSYPTITGTGIAIQVPSSLAASYALTLPTALPGSSGSFVQSDTSGNLSFLANNNINLLGKAVQEQGQNVVVSNTNATNSLAIIRGSVAINGVLSSGEGFTPSIVGTGNYSIGISSTFADAPAMLVSCTLAGRIITMSQISSSTFQVLVENLSGNPDNTPFSFLLIGQRP